MTTDFLEWLWERVLEQVVLIWDNASWHVSKQVKTWLREHNQMVLQEASTGKTGVRIIPCWLPTKSPWLNRIEPKWVHGKRAIAEPARLLTASELRQRVYDSFGCEQVNLLSQKSAECGATPFAKERKSARMDQSDRPGAGILLSTDRKRGMP